MRQSVKNGHVAAEAVANYMHGGKGLMLYEILQVTHQAGQGDLAQRQRHDGEGRENHVVPITEKMDLILKVTQAAEQAVQE